MNKCEPAPPPRYYRHSAPKADGLNYAETKKKGPPFLAFSGPSFDGGSRPIRKRAYYRAMNRGERWGAFVVSRINIWAFTRHGRDKWWDELRAASMRR